MIDPTYSSPARYISPMVERGRPMGEPGRFA
jgi:hypothetical protein